MTPCSSFCFVSWSQPRSRARPEPSIDDGGHEVLPGAAVEVALPARGPGVADSTLDQLILDVVTLLQALCVSVCVVRRKEAKTKKKRKEGNEE